jgi:hypothetical protein
MFEYDSVNVEFLVQMDGDVHLNATIVAKEEEEVRNLDEEDMIDMDYILIEYLEIVVVEEVYDKHPDVE